MEGIAFRSVDSDLVARIAGRALNGRPPHEPSWGGLFYYSSSDLRRRKSTLDGVAVQFYSPNNFAWFHSACAAIRIELVSAERESRFLRLLQAAATVVTE